MKTKVISLLLCLVMALSLVPAALAEGEDLSVYNGNEAVTARQLEKNTGKTLTLAVKAEAAAYQWQIHIEGDLWANISGETGKALTVHSGMVSGRGSSAEFRCLMDKTPSDTVTVTLVEGQPAKAPAPKAPEVLKEAQPVGEPQIVEPAAKAAPKAEEAPANDPAEGDENPVAPAAEGQADETPTPSTSTCNIIINYVFENGAQAANPWTATVAKGSSYAVTVASPMVVGYTPDQASVDVAVTDIQKDAIYTVTYTPDKVTFTVEHYQQNVDDDKYTLAETETKEGRTEQEVGEGLGKTYDGFTALLYDPTTKIAADGSTVVKVYYDRNYYLLKLDLNGGYGAEPLYARYGESISVADPQKAGYKFDHWEPSLPATMPAENTSHKAQWSTDGAVSFTVVFWYENANDDGYSYAGSISQSAEAGTSVNSGTYKNTNFTGRDGNHFTYNTAKAETVTVNGDGSTVLNVYFTRNTYTLTFKGGKTEITCGKEEHEHTYDGWYYKVLDGTYYYGGCYPAGSYNGLGTGTGGAKSPTCGKAEHTHHNSCYKTSDLTITAKYQADIHNNFPIKDGNDTIWWTVPNGCKSFTPGTQLGSIDTMPGENITFEKNDSESGAKIYYYVETINGAAGDITHGGRNYKQYKVIDLKYSSSTSLTYSEEFHPITGFTQGDSNPYLPKDGKVRMQQNNYLYYTRNSYNLKFYNYNAFVDGKGGSVQFEAPLNGYNFVPDYPAKLEENAYKFAGWYTTPECFDGSEVNWDTITMPADDLTLYAKWVPTTHKVTTWLTEKMDVPVYIHVHGETNEQIIPHGGKATEPPQPENGNQEFISWFYNENGVEKAFDFSMPVTRDLNLYAKWRNNALVKYTIHYQLANGTKIADDTEGSALAGSTKTFDAKGGTDLYEDYREGYFPETNSHSIKMEIDGNNEYIFVYVPRAKVKYTVRYLDKATEEPVVVNGVPTPDKTAETSNAVITEKFLQIAGYAPDAYQKRLVLSVNEDENVIIFWYVKDNVHAPVQIIHWTQNIAGDGYTEYQSSTDLNAVIGKEYSENPLELPGFTYNAGKSTASGKLTEAGLVLNLYYDRNEYPYEFRFLEQGTDTKLADAVTGNARYQAQVTQTAKTIPGYTLVSAENQAINIAIEDPANVASKNVRVFYYVEQTVEIKYAVVGPTGCGTLDNYQESQLKVITGEVKGSTPTANPGFKFVGWFMDEPCDIHVESVITGAVDATTNKMTPQKRPGANLHFAATYYAKFEPDVADLTITKTGAEDIDENQSFIFTVTGPNNFSAKVVVQGNGSVTIKGLKIGTYTVTEDTDWSWRYTPKNKTQNITLQPAGKNEVTFINSRSKGKWLGGDAYNHNILLPLEKM